MIHALNLCLRGWLRLNGRSGFIRPLAVVARLLVREDLTIRDIDGSWMALRNVSRSFATGVFGSPRTTPKLASSVITAAE